MDKPPETIFACRVEDLGDVAVASDCPQLEGVNCGLDGKPCKTFLYLRVPDMTVKEARAALFFRDRETPLELRLSSNSQERNRALVMLACQKWPAAVIKLCHEAMKPKGD